MSIHDANDPLCNDASHDAIDAIIEARCQSIGDFSVGRLLPSAAARTVGPIVFFDHMGPADLAPGQGIQVRPHPHINLATVTYLFEGEIEHRDSLGVHQTIAPGAINWMTAGRGIVHSERSSQTQRESQTRLDGIQLWIALPKEHEEIEPSFVHHPATSIPEVKLGEATARILVGSAWGRSSPVQPLHPMLYIDISLPAGSEVSIPIESPERAVYVASGRVQVAHHDVESKSMALLRPDTEVVLRADVESRVMLIGGAPLDGPRHLWWNFVSSSKERIAQAKADWAAGRFPKVADDEEEFIPLPSA